MAKTYYKVKGTDIPHGRYPNKVVSFYPWPNWWVRTENTVSKMTPLRKAKRTTWAIKRK